LDLRLSRSYGPGRYDPNYEEKGHDYPYGYVRWTEQRNMEAFLQLVADGSVRLDPLITHRFSIDDAIRAYDLITGKAGEPSLGIVLTYDLERHLAKQVAIAAPEKPRSDAHSSQASIQLGMVGAGNFVKAALLPAMRGLPGLELQSIVSGSGVNAQSAAKRFGFSYCTSEMEELLADEHINWLAIATRHNLHADQAVASLQAGKDTYVEKPLALNREELVRVIRAQEQSGKRLMVGFNRRFAPMVKTIKERLARHNSPLTMIYRCNAGMIPAEHWTQDPNIGGGRIIGEACHFVDLLQFFADAPPVKVYANAVKSDQGLVEDEAIITLAFADGSVGTVIYTAGGDKSFSKERIELLGGGLVAALDDFRSLELILDGKRVRQKEYMRPDKGLRGEWEVLLNNVSTGAATPIRVDEIVATHLATFAAVESLRSGNPITIDYEAFWTEVQG
jgi:predicted dehydrogenase